MAPRALSFTSESVTEGPPDKIADQISDSVLAAILVADPQGGPEVATRNALDRLGPPEEIVRAESESTSYAEPTTYATPLPASPWGGLEIAAEIPYAAVQPIEVRPIRNLEEECLADLDQGE